MDKRPRRIRIYGPPLSDIEPDLFAQLVLMLARQLAQEAVGADGTPDGPPGDKAGEAASA